MLPDAPAATAYRWAPDEPAKRLELPRAAGKCDSSRFGRSEIPWLEAWRTPHTETSLHMPRLNTQVLGVHDSNHDNRLNPKTFLNLSALALPSATLSARSGEGLFNRYVQPRTSKSYLQDETKLMQRYKS